ncbi:MAG: hypothetical protein RIR01_2243 [Bacteroidota bacterium]|jgi:hypothetical protein
MNPFDKYSADVLLTLKENTALTTDTSTTPSLAVALKNTNFGSLGANIKVFLEAVSRSAGSVEILNIQFDSVDTFDSANLVTYSASNYKTKIYANDRTIDTEPFTQTKLSAAGKSAIAFSSLHVTPQEFCRVNIKTTGFTGTYRVSAVAGCLTDPIKQV